MAEEAMDWARWGHLGDRYRDVQRPHRVLALDGGGIRGLITLEVLVRWRSSSLGAARATFRLSPVLRPDRRHEHGRDHRRRASRAGCP